MRRGRSGIGVAAVTALAVLACKPEPKGEAKGQAQALLPPPGCTSDVAVRDAGRAVPHWDPSPTANASHPDRPQLILQGIDGTVSDAQVRSGAVIARLKRTDAQSDPEYKASNTVPTYYWVGECGGALKFAFVNDDMSFVKRGTLKRHLYVNGSKVGWRVRETSDTVAVVGDSARPSTDTLSDSAAAALVQTAGYVYVPCAQCGSLWCRS